jgi:hypothetical protein
MFGYMRIVWLGRGEAYEKWAWLIFIPGIWYLYNTVQMVPVLMELTGSPARRHRASSLASGF